MSDKSLSITPKKGKKLTRDQQWFNSRINRLHQLQAELKAIEGLVPQINSYYMEKISPLVEEAASLRAQVLLSLSEEKKKKKYTKSEKESLADLYESHAWDLIEGHHQTALIPHLEELMGNTYEEMKSMENEEGRELMEEMAKEVLGVDLDFSDFSMDDLKNPEKLFEVVESLKDKIEEEEEHKDTNQSTKEKKAAEKKAQETKNLTKTIKGVYNELVKYLHPDREADEKERERKNELMQEVTTAYKEGNFINLLNLRLKILNKGHSEDLQQLSAKELKQYNELLLEQIREMEFMIQSFDNAEDFASINPAAEYYGYGEEAFEEMEEKKWDLLAEIREHQEVLKGINTQKGAKEFLKSVKFPDEGIDILSAFADMFDEEKAEFQHFGSFSDDNEDDLDLPFPNFESPQEKKNKKPLAERIKKSKKKK